METLIINSHLTYPGWSDCKLNLTFLEIRFEKVAESHFLSEKEAAFLHHRNWDDFWHNLNLKNR